MADRLTGVLRGGSVRMAAVLAALVAGWAVPALAVQDVVLQLNGGARFEYAGYYAAIEQGYYFEAGLNVTLSEPEPGAALVDAIAAGKAQYGISGPDLILERAKGQPVVALAPIFQHSPYVFLTTKTSGIRNIHDLMGKRIMHIDSAADLLAYLEAEGIDAKDVTLLPAAESPSVLIDGTADVVAARTTDEALWQNMQGVEYYSFTPRAGGVDFYGDTLFTSMEYAKRHTEAINAFLDATRRGWQYALVHPEELVGLIRDKYGSQLTSEQLLQEANETNLLIMPDVVEIGYSNPGRWQAIADTYVSLGMLQPSFQFHGFLYQPDEPVVPTWFYQVLLIAVVVIIAVSLTAVRFYRLHETVRRQAESLQKAIDETKVLRGLLPVCSHCKKIRDDSGYWQNVDTYIRAHTEAAFTHGICPECLEKYYPEVAEEVKQDILNEAAAAAAKK
jgi:ABC-type nitrate/sulfonate/bicarbonate transport system substrate-binding protein